MDAYQFEKMVLKSKRELPQGNFSLNQKNASYVGKKIANAINKNHKIIIYGDYDADGIATSTMMKEFLEDVSKTVKKNPTIDITISTRYSSGYGMSADMIEKLSETHNLIIGIDHGANADFLENYTKIFADKESDMVVFDHHLSENNQYDFIINPATEGIVGISSGLVAKKFIDYFLDKTKIDIEPKKYADLEAVTIISDMAKMNNYSRERLKEGLEEINKKKRFVFKSSAGEIKHRDLSFGVISKINAVGRMRDDVNFVTDWLKEDKDYLSWREKTVIIDAINDEKKKLINKYFNAFLLQSEKEKDDGDNIRLYVADDIPIGLNGLIAQKLFQNTNKETIVMSLHNDVYSGSGRGFDIHNTLTSIQEAMSINEEDKAFHFGGHYAAVGLKIKPENLDNFSFHCFHSQPKQRQEVKILDSISVSQLKEFGEILSDITENIPLDRKFWFSLENYDFQDIKRFKSNYASVMISDGKESSNFFVSLDVVPEDHLRSGKPLKVAVDELYNKDSYSYKGTIDGILNRSHDDEMQNNSQIIMQRSVS